MLNKKRIVRYLCVLFLVAVALIFFRYDIKILLNKLDNGDYANRKELTEEEKMEDFEYLYETLVNSIPMIDKYEELFQISFRERKDYYKELVKSTHTDFEFFCVIEAMINDIPSFHTDLVSPYSIDGLRCYNGKKIRADVGNDNKYWQELIQQVCRKAIGREFYCFSYIDGEYVFNTIESSNEKLDWNEKYILVAVEGMDVGTYVKYGISTYPLSYDGKNKISYRENMVFNDVEGTKVSLKLQKEDGTVVCKECFYSIYSEEIYQFKDRKKTNDEVIYVYEDENISYIKIDSMSITYGEKIKESILGLKNENVILDLRECYGGSVNVASEYIYPALFTEDVSISNKWYVPNTIENQAIEDNTIVKLKLKLKPINESPYSSVSERGYLVSEIEQLYNGATKKNRNVVILVSQKTGSAADRFVSVLKHNQLGTIIGNNTGGEGLMESYIAHKLPNSELVFVYMPGGALNPDGSDNSVYGTSPNIYVLQSYEDFCEQLEMQEQDKNINDYNTKRKYDTVLKYSIEYLKNLQ